MPPCIRGEAGGETGHNIQKIKQENLSVVTSPSFDPPLLEVEPISVATCI